MHHARNMTAFLSMIRACEIGEGLIKISDRGYNVIVGSTIKRPNLFVSYHDHPRQLVTIHTANGKLRSTAAGAYQILARYYDHYKKELKLTDFSPTSQDAIAIRMIREQKAHDDVMEGRFLVAVDKCRNLWASLPGAGYNQPEKTVSFVKTAFLEAGGVIA